MDRVFSTRMDEELIKRVNRFVREKTMTKKGLVEEALREYLKHLDENVEDDIVERSFGAWKRTETGSETWIHSRKTFNNAFY